MQIIRHIQSIPPAARGCVVAIGNFDGLHLGHQHLIQQAFDYAQKQKESLAVLSFEPHPKHFFAPDLPPFRLTPFAAKAQLLRAFGVDYFCCLAFTKKLSQLTAQDFIQKILISGLNASAIFVGTDFVFGHARGGTTETLRQFSSAGNYTVHGSELLLDNAEIISSSRIREALKRGDCDLATRLLGRPWQITGHVRHGQQLANKLGFPTANIGLGDYQHPAYGVYAVRVSGKNLRRLPGVANIGMRPTVGGIVAQCEAHLLDWQGDLYGQRLNVELMQFIRPEKKFAGLDELKTQIARDADQARIILK